VWIPAIALPFEIDTRTNQLQISQSRLSNTSIMRCKLLRCNEQNFWVECVRPCVLEVTGGKTSGVASSLIVRDSETGSLIGDFPLASISKAESLNRSVVRIHIISGAKVAIRFEDHSDSSALIRLLSGNQIACSNVEAPSFVPENTPGGVIPNLNDPAVQELALKLLFREDFQQFCQDLSDLLDGFKSRL
jgi:hypothetical protein